MRFQILRETELTLRASDVTIKVVPDLFVEHNKKIKLLKFFFAQKHRKHDRRLFRKMCELLYAAQLEKGFGLHPESIMHLDVSKGSIMKGEKSGYNFNEELNKVSGIYKEIWDVTKDPKQ